MSGRGLPDNTPPRPSREAWGDKGFRPPFDPCGPWAVVVMYAEPWTTREIEVMRERGYMGAEAVRRALLAECGSDRTIRSIESQASRYHVSLKVRHVCPECGVVGIRLNRQSGLCPACTERLHLAEEVAFNEILQREAEEKAGEAEVASIRRERDRMRKRNSRLCKRHGLKTRRERKQND